MAANVRRGGGRAKSMDFVSLENISTHVEGPELERIKKLGAVPHGLVQDIDNPETYEWYQVGTEKYGRYMYCIKTGIKRTQTIAEFYQTSTVD